jgi:hypothetical protein
MRIAAARKINSSFSISDAPLPMRFAHSVFRNSPTVNLLRGWVVGGHGFEPRTFPV